MRILSDVLRVILGFVVACLVAGAATVAFVITPSDIAHLSPDARPERLGDAGILALLAATHSAIFAFPFALLAAAIAEWRSIRSWIYYLLVGLAIALLGFAGLHHFEVPGQPSIVNEYAVRAFVVVGILGGLAYWLVAGRLAGRAPAAAAEIVAVEAASTTKAPLAAGKAEKEAAVDVDRRAVTNNNKGKPNKNRP
jgi:hypothetical protein